MKNAYPIQIHFQNQKERYLQILKETFRAAIGTVYEIGMFNFSYGLPENMELTLNDLDICNIDLLPEGLSFKTSVGFNLPLFGTAEYKTCLELSYSQDAKMETLFWQDQNNVTAYNTISQFNAFEDVIVDEKDVQKYKKRGQLYNIDGWCQFLKNILSLLYNDYEMVKQPKKSNVIFQKKLSEQTNISIEYHEKQYADGLKKGHIDLPKMVIVSNEVLSKSENRLLVLGELQEPYLGYAGMPIHAYAARHTLIEKEEGWFETVNRMIYEALPNGKMKIHNSETFGEALKQHLYFSMSVNAFFTKRYLHFLESLII